jgi:hypothetical protein
MIRGMGQLHSLSEKLVGSVFDLQDFLLDDPAHYVVTPSLKRTHQAH